MQLGISEAEIREVALALKFGEQRKQCSDCPVHLTHHFLGIVVTIAPLTVSGGTFGPILICPACCGPYGIPFLMTVLGGNLEVSIT